MITLLVYLAVFVILAIVVWWVLQQVSLPSPLDRIVQIAFVVIGAFFIIWIILGFAHIGGVEMPALK